MKNPQRVVDSTFDKLQARQGLAGKSMSQMTKLLPMLNLAAKKTPEESQVKAKLELRLKKLENLKAQVGNLVLLVSNLHKVDNPKRLKRLTKALLSIDTLLANKVPLGTAKLLKISKNELVSIREGAYINPLLNKNDLDAVETLGIPDKLDKLINQTQANLNELKPKVVNSADEEQLLYSSIESVLSETKLQESSVEALKTEKFVVATVSIVPMSSYVINANALTAKGFKVVDMGGYPVLHNQLVVGINRKLIDKERAEKAKIDLNDSKAVKKLGETSVFDEAEKIRKILEKQHAQDYRFVFDRPHGASGGAWFWLMRQRDLDAFVSTFPGGQAKLLRFGFAF